MYYEQSIRGQIAAERIERIADACARASAAKYVRRRWRRRLSPAAGLEPVEPARRGAAHLELQR